MERSENIANLAAALAAAQGSFRAAEQNAQNPFLKNRYADLGSVIEASRKPLADNGLAVVQVPSIGDDMLTVTMTVMHASGEWIACSLGLKIAVGKGMSEAQSMGATITYLRRYLWSSMLGIYSGDDNDGHKDEKPSKPTTKAPPEPKAAQPPAPPTPEEAQALKDVITRIVLYVPRNVKAAFDASTKPDKYSQKTLEYFLAQAMLTPAEISEGVKDIAQAYGNTSQEALDFSEAVRSNNWLTAIDMLEAAAKFVKQPAPSGPDIGDGDNMGMNT